MNLVMVESKEAKPVLSRLGFSWIFRVELRVVLFVPKVKLNESYIKLNDSYINLIVLFKTNVGKNEFMLK